MKKILFLILIMASNFVQAQAPDPDFSDKAAFSESRAYQKSVTFTESENFGAFDLVYQKLNFTVDPAVNFIAGSVFSLVKYRTYTDSQIQFDLTDSLTVDSVKCNSEITTFQHSGNKINITLLMPMPINSISPVEIFYHGSPPQTGFGSFTVSKHNKIPVIWTLSEPYGAKDWWPCKESLADKIDSLDVFITCPEQYKAASNGKLISDQVRKGKRTAHWQHRYPIATYLVAIAVTNYETYSDILDIPDGNKIEVLNYIYPEYLTTAKSKSTEILSILEFYNSKLITYPFASEKYGHAQFGWGGGMEHQTMSFMTNLDFELVAHEMVHQWFGDYITLASWHDIWLNEGFATYFTGLAYENLLNGVYWPLWKDYQVKRITSSPDGSVYLTDTTDVTRMFNGRLSYSKGGYLLHMLRWEIGDELFFKGIKNYLNDPSIGYGFASHEKFVKHMETVADTSFTEFFQDWYYGEGYPVYILNYSPDPVNPAKQILRISQSPSHVSVEFFEAHIPVRVWKDAKYKDLRLYHTQQNQEFIVSDERIDSVQFDPEKWLCAKADKVLPSLEISKSEQIQIIPEYPNHRIRVIIPGFSGKGTLRIFDLYGRTIISKILQEEDSWVDLNGLKKGIYLVEVKGKDQRRTEKIRISK